MFWPFSHPIADMKSTAVEPRGRILPRSGKAAVSVHLPQGSRAYDVHRQSFTAIALQRDIDGIDQVLIKVVRP